jgi:hypothetical protein
LALPRRISPPKCVGPEMRWAEFPCKRNRVGGRCRHLVDGLTYFLFTLCSNRLDQSRASSVDRDVRTRSRVRCPTMASRWSAGRRRALRYWASAPEAATPGNRGPAAARGGPRLWVRQPAAIRRWRLPALHPLVSRGKEKGDTGQPRGLKNQRTGAAERCLETFGSNESRSTQAPPWSRTAIAPGRARRP